MGFETIDWPGLLFAVFHDLAVAVYLGGSVAMEFVIGPAQKAIPPAQAQVMGEKTADRFLKLAWGALTVILITGLSRLWIRGFFQVDWFWEINYTRTVITMFTIWLVLVINGALITFVFRPRLTGKLRAGVSSAQVTTSQDEKIRAARWIQNLTRVDLGLALLAVFLGASLVRGGLL
jgi:uncharacterized membrane protein